ncbi:hypothetical protein AB0H86_18530 [Streptomyces sp. NPDC050997]|uniref:hypothetical protein n=1 Tax=Streptomyces sp. NPDC050997 TaxID=3155519 RepID=UPI00341C9A4F
MTQLRLSADAIAESRFAVSPVMQLAAALHPHHPGAIAGHRSSPSAVRRTLITHGLHLLLALRDDMTDYLPDFLTPPTETPVSDVDTELHRVATTAAPVMARQMRRLMSLPEVADTEGEPTEGRDLPSVRRYLKMGASAYADRAARELRVFWDVALAPSWRRLAGQAQADIERHAMVALRQGMRVVLNSLHPDMAITGRWSTPGPSSPSGDASRTPTMSS